MRTPSVHAVLDDPLDPVRHNVSGTRAEPAILARHRAHRLRHPDPYHCEHASYVGFNRALAWMCPRCPEYAPDADFSNPVADWGDEGDFPNGFVPSP